MRGPEAVKQVPGVFFTIVFSTFNGGNENASKPTFKVPHRKKSVTKLVSREGPATTLVLPRYLLALYKEKLSFKGKFYHPNIRKASYNIEYD